MTTDATGWGRVALYTPLERAMPGIVWRPQVWKTGAIDYTSNTVPDWEIERDEFYRPVVMREIAWGHQTPDGGRVYTGLPGVSYERGGMACGGVFVCLPGQLPTRTYLLPTIEDSQGRDALSYRVHAPRVWRGHGLPDLETGDLQENSWRIGNEGITENLLIQRMISGTWTNVLQIGEGGSSFGSTLQATSYRVGSNQVVGARGAAVADATDAASAITQLNALLARCRAHGLIAT